MNNDNDPTYRLNIMPPFVPKRQGLRNLKYLTGLCSLMNKYRRDERGKPPYKTPTNTRNMHVVENFRSIAALT